MVVIPHNFLAERLIEEKSGGYGCWHRECLGLENVDTNMERERERLVHISYI